MWHVEPVAVVSQNEDQRLSTPVKEALRKLKNLNKLIKNIAKALSVAKPSLINCKKPAVVLSLDPA